MIWQYLQYVTTGLTLAAFAIAAGAWIYKSSSEKSERLIRTAPEEERSALVSRALEFFDINTQGLTKEQQYRLALAQIHSRAQRFRTIAMVVCLLALALTGISLYAIHKSNDKNNGNTDVGTSNEPAITPPKFSLTNWMIGSWEAVINNSNSSSLQISEASLVVVRKGAPDFAYPISISDSELKPKSVTKIKLVLFDSSPQGFGNLLSMQSSPALQIFNSSDGNCKLVITFTDITHKKHSAHEAFGCSRVPFPRPKP